MADVKDNKMASNAPKDMDKYRAMLAEYDLTDDERDEFICMMWSLLKNFVDLGFGVDATSQVLKQLWKNAGIDVDEVVDLEETESERTMENGDE
jgi:hypothetical protein